MKLKLADKIRSLWRKHRLSLRDERDNKELWYMYISPLSIAAGFIALILVLFIVILSTVAYTPLLEFLPGYQGNKSRTMLMENIVRLDSMERQLNQMKVYSDNIALIMEGKTPVMRTLTDQNQVNADKTIVMPSAEDSILRAQLEGDGDYSIARQPGRRSVRESMELISPLAGGIIVNKFGRRFVDESLPYKLIAKAVLQQSDAKSFIVFDERIRGISERQPMDRRRWDVVPLGTGRTLAEAANQCSIDPAALQETVEAYNKAVARGEDAGRGSVAVNNGRLLTIDRPPFYVLPVSPCLLGTYCGIKINDRARVLTAQGDEIKGLWAAGEVTGGFHGASFIMGTALGKAQTFARIAAQDIARSLGEA